MTYTHGVQTVNTYDNGKRVIKSGAVGSTNVEEVRWLTEKLVSLTSAWRNTGWGYVVDISAMAPCTPEVSRELVGLHRTLAAAGCKAMAFVNFAAFITGAQAKEHQKKSNTDIQEGHFRTEEDALKWLGTVIR